MLSLCSAVESAEIVVFPGVRYDRDCEDSASDRAKAKRHSEDPELES